MKLDQPTTPPYSLWHALRELGAAQRTIERVGRQFPDSESVARRLDRISTLILHLPLDETMLDTQDHPRCTVCGSADLAEIEEMILAGESLRRTAARFPPLSHSSLYRHFQNHHLQEQASDFDREAWGY